MTGQARTTARIGRAGVRESFLGERGGLERAALGQTRQFQAGLARAGFAGGGALERGRETGRRQLGEQFTTLLGRRRTGLEDIGARFERGLFGARETVGGEQASLLAALMGGVQNLRATLRGEGVFTGEGLEEPLPPPTPPPPIRFPDLGDEDRQPKEGPEGQEILSYNDWLRERGLVGPESWLRGRYDDYVRKLGGEVTREF